MSPFYIAKLDSIKKNKYLPHGTDFIVIVLLFFIAISIRLNYQREAIIDHPIRADAREYFFAAFNLYRFNVYSSSPSLPGDNIPPQTEFRRPPGYPLFLFPFVATSNNGEQFLDRVTAAQALLGSLTVVVLYVIGRYCFVLPWAFFAGLLTAFSPHLVAIEHFVLTESLFTFTLVLATLMITLSLQRKQPALSILAGTLFAFATLVRPLALMLGPFIGTVYLFQAKKSAFPPKSIVYRQIICLFIGYLLIYCPYLVIRNKAVSGSFSVSGQSTWEHFVKGSDVNLKKFLKSKTDPELRKKTEQMIQDKLYGLNVLKERFLSKPFSYFKWYFGGKLFFMWKWDNIYIGDVYQYPMIRKGFHTNINLHAIHRLMHFLHWPLYLLTLIAPIFLLVNCRFGRLKPRAVFLLSPLFIFIYFAVLLTLLTPLPRYSIPVRPFSYLLAVYGLSQILLGLYWLIKNSKYISSFLREDFFKLTKRVDNA